MYLCAELQKHTRKPEMRNVKIKDRVIIVLISTLLVVISSAFLVNRTLQNIINNITEEAQPNARLVHLKSVLYIVTNAESQVKSYGITFDEDYLTRYNQSITRVDSTLKLLYREAKGDSAFVQEVKRIDSLSNKKFEILDELLIVTNEQSIRGVLEKVENRVAPRDFEEADQPITNQDENSRFFKKLFGARKTENDPAPTSPNQNNVDFSFQLFNTEFNALKNREIAREEELKARELGLIQANQETMDEITTLVQKLETIEDNRLQIKLAEAEKEGSFTRSIIAVFCIISCILLLLAGYIISVYIKRNDAYKQDLESSKNETERFNQEIVSSITYAQRLQAAILPDETKIARLLPNSFIFYKPKDIVTGDFYWLVESENYTYVAVADCTGHGVPGAMISMTCLSALERSVREFGLKTPAEILDNCLRLIMETFDGGDFRVYDGMDIALCRIDRKNMKLQYSGANNNLYYISNDEPQIIAADRQSVCRFSKEKPFTNHEISIKSTDTFFIYTDGLQDQFGGPKQKKLMPHRVKKFLAENVNRTFDEQAVRIEKAFEEWKGNTAQIDDICLMGFQV